MSKVHYIEIRYLSGVRKREVFKTESKAVKRFKQVQEKKYTSMDRVSRGCYIPGKPMTELEHFYKDGKIYGKANAK